MNFLRVPERVRTLRSFQVCPKGRLGYILVDKIGGTMAQLARRADQSHLQICQPTRACQQLPHRTTALLQICECAKRHSRSAV